MDNGAVLYRRFLDGSESAFDEIMKLYFDNLVFFLDRMIHDTAQSEDIAIDVFALLASNTSHYNFKVSLKTYIFMLGRSRALNYIKHRNKLKIVEIDSVDDEAAERELLEDKLFDQSRKTLIHSALSKLPEDMRLAVYLVYFEELSYEEAAKVMRKNKKQVDNLLYRAKKVLRTAIGKEGEQFL